MTYTEEHVYLLFSKRATRKFEWHMEEVKSTVEPVLGVKRIFKVNLENLSLLSESFQFWCRWSSILKLECILG